MAHIKFVSACFFLIGVGLEGILCAMLWIGKLVCKGVELEAALFALVRVCQRFGKTITENKYVKQRVKYYGVVCYFY